MDDRSDVERFPHSSFETEGGKVGIALSNEPAMRCDLETHSFAWFNYRLIWRKAKVKVIPRKYLD